MTGCTEQSAFVVGMVKATSDMWMKGWDERNGGNVSMRLSEEDVAPFLSQWTGTRVAPISAPVPELAGQYYIVTGTGPVPTLGACTLICVGLMKYTNAGWLPTFTLTPSSTVGSLPFTMALSQVSVPGAGRVERLLPVMVSQEPGTMPGWKLAPLTTPPASMEGTGPAEVGVRVYDVL